MRKTVAIGIQSFDKIRKDGYFYIDKTGFIREWWESG
ncbi:MAG: AAA family ATPase, partial [Oliverpabstia sp.]|nr:AAA family ATPase [Oliverpabstia sp.]